MFAALDNFFVVRLHSADTDDELVLREAKLKHDRPTFGNDFSPEGQALLRDMKLASEIKDLCHNTKTTKHLLVHDRRVQKLDLSLGHRMSQYTSLAPGGPKASDPSRWDDFRALYLQFKSDTSQEMFSKDDKKRLGQNVRCLRSDALPKAAADALHENLALN